MPAHAHGTRKAESTNIENPVAMPSGGMMIFRKETALRASRKRHMMTTIAPAPAARNEPATLAKNGEIGGSATMKLFYWIPEFRAQES